MSSRQDGRTRAWLQLGPLLEVWCREAEIVGATLDGVAERTGLPRQELPAVPEALERPAMVLVDAASACHEVSRWLVTREAWARVLGRLQPLLADTPLAWNEA